MHWRVRSTDLRTPTSALYQSRSDPGSAFTDLVTTELLGTYKVVQDCYATRKSMLTLGGVLPFKAAFFSETKAEGKPLQLLVTVPPGNWVGEQGTWWPGLYGQPVLDSAPGYDESIVTYVTNAAIAQSKSGNWDALTFLGELRETTAMIGGVMNRFFDLTDRMVGVARKIKRDGAFSIRAHRSVMEIFDDLWLEGRYGWRPLVKDVDSMAKALAYRSEELISKEGHSKVVVNGSHSPAPVVTVAGRAIFTGTAIRVGTRTYRGFALSTGRMANVEYRPLQAGWELLTLSFVVDKFIDVGSAIAAATLLPGVDTPASGFSIKDEYEETFGLVAADNPAVASTLTSNQPYQMHRSYRSYTRTPRSAAFPRLFPRLDKLGLVDLAALATSRFNRLLRNLTR